MKQCSINSDIGPIHYRKTGAGKPIMLIHGLGEDGRIWDETAAKLEKEFCLIIPEIKLEVGPDSYREEVGMETYAEMMKAIADKEQLEKFIMIGHSMGGYITLAFAEKYPERLNAFGLVHSSAFADSDEKKQARLKSIAFITENGSAAFLKTSIPGLFMPNKESNKPAIADLLKKGNQITASTLIQHLRAMIARPNRTAVLKQFPKPILFIIGEHDLAIPFAHSMQQCYLPIQSHVNIFRDTAHMSMLEEREKFFTVLSGFLRGSE